MATNAKRDDLFEYVFPSGETIRILKFGLMPAGVIRQTRKLAPSDLIFTALEQIADEDALAVFDRQGQLEAADFVQAWQEDAQSSVGKS